MSFLAKEVERRYEEDLTSQTNAIFIMINLLIYVQISHRLFLPGVFEDICRPPLFFPPPLFLPPCLDLLPFPFFPLFSSRWDELQRINIQFGRSSQTI